MRLYMSDRCADPPLESKVADYIAAGLVEYTWWKYSQEYYEDLNRQLGLKKQCVWMALFTAHDVVAAWSCEAYRGS
jgi:hypothetical protein